MLSKHKQFKYDNDESYEEHEEGNAVNAMHVLHPPGMRSLGVSLLYVKIFGQLSQYTHSMKLSSTQNYNNKNTGRKTPASGGQVSFRRMHHLTTGYAGRGGRLFSRGV